MTIKQRLNKLKMAYRLLVSRYQLYWGAYLLRKGALYQPGQKIIIPAGRGPSLTGRFNVIRKSTQTVWIANMFYNFNLHKITYQFSDKPIRGKSEKFNEHKG